MNTSYWRTIAIVTLWQVAASICYYTVFAATPFFRDVFELSRFSVGLVVTALTLGYAVFLLPLGAFTDRYGERPMLIFGLIGLSIGSFLVTRAWSYGTLLVAAFLLGSTYGTAMPGTNKAIFDRIAEGGRNLAMGLKQVGVTAGSGASAVLVTGLATTEFGWHAGFFVASLLGVAVTVVFAVFYRDAAESGVAKYPDISGLLDNAPYRALVSAGFFLGAGLFTTVGYTILYVHESVGTTVGFAGIILAVVQIAGSGGRIITGWLGDVLPGDPQRRTCGILIVQAAASAVLFVAITLVDTRLSALVGFATLGFFVLGFTGIYYSCLGTVVAADEVGSATAGGQLALTSGALLAPPTFGYLSDVLTYRSSWLFLSVLCVIALVFLARVFNSTPPEGRAVV